MRLAALVLTVIFFANIQLAFTEAKGANKWLKNNEPQYKENELVVKLKPGKKPQDVKELNLKYGVTSTEKLFQYLPTPEDILAKLKDEFSGLNHRHDRWFWQLDKNSQEYRDYAAKIENKKNQLQQEIQAVEAVARHKQQRQKKAAQNIQPPNLENIYLFTTSQQTAIPSMAAAYQTHPSVEYAEPNFFIYAKMVPNDYLYLNEPRYNWALKQMSMEEAWDLSQGQNTIVAVVDSGVDYKFEDLSANMHQIGGKYGFDFVDNDDNPLDEAFHGTFMSLMISAVGNNQIAFIGVAPQAKILAVRVLDSKGRGISSEINQGLRYAADQGADVINMSCGGSGISELIKDTANYAYSKGCVLVAAAGNEDENVKYTVPANIPYFITVAATDRYEQRCDFSNYGFKVDVAAPGEISLPMENGETQKIEGTSLSCAFVSGVAALLVSKFPDFSPEQIKKAIFISAIDKGASGWDRDYGFGRIDAKYALQHNSRSYTLARIRNPKPNQQFKEGAISIEGTALCSSFSAYKIEIGEGDYPSSWSGSGITLRNSGGQQVVDDVLGSLDISGLNEGVYSLRLRVFDNNAAYKGHTTSFFIKKSTASGWPQQVYSGANYGLNHPVAIDINNDGKLEIFAGSQGGMLYAWKHDGTNLPNWPIALGNPVSTPTIGDLDGDEKAEVVAAVSNPGHSKKVHIFNLDASPYSPGKWPKEIPEGKHSFNPPLALADLNSDGKLDLLAADENKLYAWNYNGDNVAGAWPVSLDSANEYILALAVGNIDSDPDVEVIAATIDIDSIPEGARLPAKGKVYAWEKNGTRKWIYPDGSLFQPVIADINGDNYPEVVVNGLAGLAALRDGTVMPGWTVLSTSGDNKMLGVGTPVLADLDQDTIPEIILAGEGVDSGERSKVWVYKGNGASFGNWPYSFYFNRPAVISGAVAADINNDKQQEVIVPVYDPDAEKSYLYIFSSQGDTSRYPGYPKRLDIGAYCLPVIADLDNDGSLEIASYGDEDQFYVYRLLDNSKKGALAWPMYGANPQHTGSYTPIDTSPPITAIAELPRDWSTQPLTITLTSTDSQSAAIETYYSLDGSKPNLKYSGPFSLEDGIYNLNFFSIDDAGNQEATKSLGYPLKIDSIPPYGGEIRINNYLAFARLNSLDLSISLIEKGSGMGQGAEMKFSNDGVNYSPAEPFSAQKVWPLASDSGLRTVYAQFKDAAGNHSTYTVSLNSETAGYILNIPGTIAGTLPKNPPLPTGRPMPGADPKR
ncbi:MAG: S8 family serine peptidase [Candidatus Omnitrophota bacterium]